jgi:hypothetical protein
VRSSSTAPPPSEAGELPPTKVAWLHPMELLRTGYNVWLSTIAKEYIDRRETLAALGTVKRPNDGLPAAILARGRTIDATYPAKQPDNGLWIDFVADIGDSWEATYATATLLAKQELRVRGHADPLRTADVVVLGGDLVYPTPNRERYRRRMRAPFSAALPACSDRTPPCLFAIPGNHDWYDGLTSFVREFCQGGELGGWRLMQRRSYFAVKLTSRWWLWGIDIALDTRIDPPQQSYFLNVLKGRSAAEGFQKGDNIILCTAKPVWTESSVEPSEAYKNLNHFVQNIVAKHDGHVRVILAGDLHHYSRYENPARDQMITAGGGGAYLTGTQHLPARVADMCVKNPTDHDTAEDPPKYQVAGFPYPSRSDSRRLALGALLLAFRPANWPFVFLVMGGLCAIFVRNLLQVRGINLDVRSVAQLFHVPIFVLVDRRDSDVWLMVAVALGAGALVTAASERNAPRPLTIAWGLLHGFLQLVLAVMLAAFVVRSSMAKDIVAWLPYVSTLTGRLGRAAHEAVFCSVIFLAGGILGATLVGIYFVVSDFLFGWHTNEVFASQSIIDYRNFVRMHIAPGGKLTIFPVGLRTVPRKWRLRLEREPAEPLYEPTDRVLDPHLIEGPIEIARR